MLGGAIGASCIDAKASDAFARPSAAKSHLRPDDEAAGAFNGLVCGLPCQLKLGAGVWRKVQQLDQTLTAGFALQDAEQVDDIAVQIVVDLGIGARLLDQHAGSAAEWFDVALVWREVIVNPGGQTKFSTVVANYGGCDVQAAPPWT